MVQLAILHLRFSLRLDLYIFNVSLTASCYKAAGGVDMCVSTQKNEERVTEGVFLAVSAVSFFSVCRHFQFLEFATKK